jgi:hypothetical protein
MSDSEPDFICYGCGNTEEIDTCIYCDSYICSVCDDDKCGCGSCFDCAIDFCGYCRKCHNCYKTSFSCTNCKKTTHNCDGLIRCAECSCGKLLGDLMVKSAMKK